MCYYLGLAYKSGGHEVFLSPEQKVAYDNGEYAIYKGFDYNQYPVYKLAADGHNLEKEYMEWGFYPTG